jgi:hypothetical protein
MTSFFRDWRDITSPIAAERRVPNVSIAWRRPGKGRPLLEFLVNARLVTQLGWKDGICARVMVAPDGSALAFVPQEGGKVLRDRGGGLAVSHRPDWIAQDLPAHSAEIAPHRIEDGCLVITLPDWARDAAAAAPEAYMGTLSAEQEAMFRRLWADRTHSVSAILKALNGMPGQRWSASTSMYGLATRLGLPTTRALMPEAAQTAFPPPHFRPPAAAASAEVQAEDEREAEALVRANPDIWHGRALAEEYGWQIRDAAAFVARIRDDMAQEAAAARDAAE